MSNAMLFHTHLFLTLYMLGIIWLIQIVHYPLMGKVGPEYFVDYERTHTQLMTWVVGPQMIAEFFTGVLLVATATQNRSLWILNLALILLIWGSTFFIQVPLHNKLSMGFEPGWHRQLVQTNWIRTLAWTIRALLLLEIIR